MDEENFSAPVKYLTGSFWVYLGCLVLLYIVFAHQPKELADVFIEGLAAVLACSALVFYVSLGVLASRMGKSWVIWVSGTFLTTPVGIIFSYWGMKNRLRTLRESATAGH